MGITIKMMTTDYPVALGVPCTISLFLIISSYHTDRGPEDG